MIEVIGIGKNVEKAIEDALVQLKTSRDNVDIKILETGGLFKKAKVQVSISEEYLQEYKKKEQKKQEFLKQDSQLKKDESKSQVVKQVYNKVFENKNQTVKETVKESVKENQPVKALAQVKPEAKAEVKPEAKQEPKQERPAKQEKVQDVKPEAQIGKEFLENFIALASIKAVVDVFEDEDEIFYTILGEEATALIGYRGESLNSLQFLVSVLNGKNNRKNKRVRIDIDGYRQKRQGTLEMLARRVAKKVQKTGKQTRLEPMSAFERRIIHTIVQEFEGVSSISRGEEPHRYLIIRSSERNVNKNQAEGQETSQETNEDN